MSEEKKHYVTLHDYCSRETGDDNRNIALVNIRKRLGDRSKVRCIDDGQQEAFENDDYYLVDNSITTIRPSLFGKPKRGEIKGDLSMKTNIIHQRSTADHWLAMSTRKNCEGCLNVSCNFKDISDSPYRG